MASLNPLNGVLGRRNAAHLLRRTSYRYTRAKVDEMAGQTAAEALATLLSPAPLQVEQPLYSDGAGAPVTWVNPPQPPSAPLPGDDGDLTRYVMGWWVNEALHDPGATHRMSLFFHQFLAVDAASGSSMEFFDYLALLRWGSLGNLKKLVTKMVTDNCMLTYVDNDQNFASNPNENFAREFFELFTVGRGAPAGPGDYTTFTEDDVIQAARVFSGFNHAQRHQYVDTETNIPAGKAYPQSHDFDPKIFSARFGGATINAPTQDAAGMVAELNAFVDLVFAQPATSQLFCRRLYHFFVTRNVTQEIEDEVIAPLAQLLVDSNFEIKPVLEKLLQSEHFFDVDDSDNSDEIFGALIKSPLELTLQALTFFSVPIPDPVAENMQHYSDFYSAAVLERMLARAGMDLFYPLDVAGYSGYYQDPALNRQFFNSATIVQRYKLPQVLLTGTHAWGSGSNDPIGTQLDVAAWLRDSGVVSDPLDSYVIVQELLYYLFPEEPDNDRFTHFLVSVFLDQLPPADWTYEWENYLNTGNDSEVKIPLGRLVNAIMYAPEYQVM
ncbi:MAG: DUF1800 family protein [Saprospiraceae bacterium]|nr:DUF1800 family protein [Saprospiraceae bacterium]